MIAGASRSFCSDDCVATAEQILAKGLEEFYRFRDGPTVTANADDKAAERWHAFDRETLQREFVNEAPDGSRQAQLVLQGVRCVACTWLIENALGSVRGVRAISVDPLTTRAILSWDPAKIRLSELLSHISRLGYTPVPYLEEESAVAGREERRTALKRLIVAGLGMMQVASFAVAMYLGAGHDPQIESYLRLVSLLVSTPVVFYAGAPFFRAAWSGLRARSLGMDVPIALAIGGAWSASAWHCFLGFGEVYFDSATMFIFFLSAARFLEMSGRHRALSLTGSLAQHLPRTAIRLDGLDTIEVGVMELNEGDRVLVAPGQVLPADGILESTNAHLDEALLTGESEPVSRKRGEPVVAGSVNIENSLEMTVSRVGAQTVMAQIGQLVGEAGAQKPRLVQIADRVASWFVAGVLLAAVAVALVWWQLAPERAFEVVLAVLVVTCPCALALATPAAFTVATSSLARLGFMLRRAGALQRLSRVSDVVFDKTGTLTGGGIRIESVNRLRGGASPDPLAIAAALESRSVHPLAKAFPPADSDSVVGDVRPIPGAGLEGTVDGHLYRIGTRAFAGGCVEDDQPESGGTDRQVFLGDATGLLAAFVIQEEVRPDASAVLRSLQARGLRLRIFSGDQTGPVSALAKSLDVADWRAAMRPSDKLAGVRELQSSGAVVAMVGDGINDSPVLAGADVSVAMGSGTSLAQHSADCVLMGDSLMPLLAATRMARRCMRIIRQNLGWAIGYNLVALPLAATGLLAPWMAALGMSASSLLVTANALRLARMPAAGPASVPEAASQASSTATRSCCKQTAGAAS